MTPETKVNVWTLDMLSSLHWLSDEEANAMRSSVDSDDEMAVKRVLREVVVPYLKALPVWGTFEPRLKRNLRYFLTTKSVSDELLEDVYAVGEPPLDGPEPLWKYYHWAWEVLYPGEDYRLESVAGYREENSDDIDMAEP